MPQGELTAGQKKFFVSGFKSVLHGAPNMDTLVALGSSASYIWSLYAMFRMTGAPARELTAWADKLYFESAAMILVLITVGKLLEEKSKGRTTDALKSLMKLAPKTATVVRDGAEQVGGGANRVNAVKLDINAELKSGFPVAIAQRVTVELENAYHELKAALPFCVCRMCQGQGCTACSSTGYQTRDQYNRNPPEFKA